MLVVNVHQRALAASAARVGQMLETLGTDRDVIWPFKRWPPMRFDRPVRIGDLTGHGPVRYRIDAYEPGRRIRFRLTAPRGCHGTHEFEVVRGADGTVGLRHRLEMDTRGVALLTWPLLIRPLHDALLEDALDNVARGCGEALPASPLSRRVRLLRAVFLRSANR